MLVLVLILILMAWYAKRVYSVRVLCVSVEGVLCRHCLLLLLLEHLGEVEVLLSAK
jgi:hypothetical protein